MPQNYTQVAVTIANGASLSGAAAIDGEIVAIELPTVTSAGLTFQGSQDNVTFRNVYESDGTTETAVGASTGARIVKAPAAIVGLAYLKVRSGTSGSAVNQGAARTIILHVLRDE